MEDNILLTNAYNLINKFDFAVPPGAIISFVENFLREYYFVNKEDIDRMYQGYKIYPTGWTENSDVIDDLERIIPDLTNNN